MADPIVVEPVVEAVIEPITFAQIVKMSGHEMKEKRKDPVLAAQIDKAIEEHNASKTEEVLEPAVDAPPVDEEAEKAAVIAEAEKAEAERLKAEETAKLEIEKVQVARIEAEKIEAARKEQEEKDRIAALPKQKIIRKYQAKDENGNPIGSPTYLEADTPEEMFEKLETAHVQAVRYADRLKKRRDGATKVDVVAPSRQLTQEEVAEAGKDLEDKDPVKKAAAVRKLSGADENERIQKEALEAAAKFEGARQSYLFLQRHVSDYNNCDANNKLVEQFIADGGLAWTADNLDLAYLELESQLAPVVRAAVVPEPDPVPVVEVRQEVVPAAPQPVPVVAPAPVIEVPAAVIPAAVVPEPVIERRIPSSGLEPGALHGARPATRVPALTMKDIKKMSAEDFKKLKNSPTGRKQLEALGIRL